MGHRGIAMSMYTHLLVAAFDERRHTYAEPTTDDALAAFHHCRDRLQSWETEADWTSTVLADQVAYDIALIDLARSVGIDCGIDTFDQPERRRIEVGRELASRGIHI